MLTMGIDIGSASTKIVVMQNGTEILAAEAVQSGTGTSGFKRALGNVSKQHGFDIQRMDYIVATGYGRFSVQQAHEQISEISCHGKGVHYYIPGVHTVVDIGGQDAKAMRITPQGTVADFNMNDKCAAGTGRFLEVMARVLEIDIGELGVWGMRSTQPIAISSACTVFAESEVISQLAAGTPKEDIVAGIHKSVAVRAASLAFRVGVEPRVAIAGGVAMNPGVVAMLQAEMELEISVPPHPQLTGAVGAALIAYDKANDT